MKEEKEGQGKVTRQQEESAGRRKKRRGRLEHKELVVGEMVQTSMTLCIITCHLKSSQMVMMVCICLFCHFAHLSVLEEGSLLCFSS